MRVTKKSMAVFLAAAVCVSGITVHLGKSAEAAGITAYLCFESKSRNGVLVKHNSADRSMGVINANKKVPLGGIKVKNAAIKKGKFSITVSATGENLRGFSGDKGWNSIYVDTSLAGKKKQKLKVKKVVLKMDGKTVKSISRPVLSPASGQTASFTKVMVVNSWNALAEKKCKASSILKMPAKSISVTVSGRLYG